MPHAEKLLQRLEETRAVFVPARVVQRGLRVATLSGAAAHTSLRERRLMALKPQSQNTNRASFDSTGMCKPVLAVLESAAGAQGEQPLVEKENGC